MLSTLNTGTGFVTLIDPDNDTNADPVGRAHTSDWSAQFYNGWL